MPVNDDEVLIIGAAQAGAPVAGSLRDLGYAGRIDLVGAERHLPYHRPPLSKTALHGDIDASTLAIRSEDYYATKQINVHLGEHIADVSYLPGGGGVATSASGAEFSFGRLVLAVGAAPRRLDVPGADADGVHYLRDEQHARALREGLRRAQSIVVIGGGFIGLELAATMRKMGKDVTIVLPVDMIMARAISPLVAGYFHRQHEARGVRILTNTAVERIETDTRNRTAAVVTTGGAVLPADLVVVGIGANPRTELAEQLGLQLDNGIAVDEHAVASDGKTVAVGDCTSIPNPLVHGKGQTRMRLESVNNAVEHAKIGAATVAGAPTPYRAVPWFWSDQFDLKLQAVGLLIAGTTPVVRGSIEEGSFSVFHYDVDDELIAVESVNAPADFMVARTALSRGRHIPADLVRSPLPLKQLVRDPISTEVA